MSSNSTSTAASSDILLLVGPILIGNLLGCFLLGVLTLQLYTYYLTFPKDSWWIRFTVYGLYILEVAQTVVIADGAWGILCVGWGKPSALVHTDWGFAMTPVASGIIAAWVQLFFAWRVWILGNNRFWKVMTVTIFAIALAQGTSAVAAGVKFAFINNVERISEIRGMVCVWLGGSVAADVLIATSMVYLLMSAKKRSTWNKSTNRMLTKFIRSAVETGALSAVAAAVDLAFYLCFNQNNIHTIFAAMLSKLYSNALLASINSRALSVRSRPSQPSSSNDDTTYSTVGNFATLQFAATTTTEGHASDDLEGELDTRAKNPTPDTQRGIALNHLAEV